MSTTATPNNSKLVDNFNRIIRWGVIAIGLFCLIIILNWMISAYLAAQWDATCKLHMKQLGTALNAYHQRFGAFPPAYVVGPDQQRWHSWRTLILPDLGQEQVYAKYRFDEPWNGPNNSLLTRQMPAIFGCPTGEVTGKGITNYLAIVGRKTAWPEFLSLDRSQVLNKEGDVLLLVESADSDISWLEPRDLTESQFLKVNDPGPAPHLCGRHRNESGQPITMHGLLVDGSVVRLSPNIDRTTLKILTRPAPGGSFIGRSLPREEGEPDEPASSFPEEQDASTLVKTEIHASPEFPLPAGKNAVYCATLQIAWDQLRRPPDGMVHASNMPDLGMVLNRAPFSLKDLNPQSYFVQSERTEQTSQLFDRLKQRFPQARFPREFLPADRTPLPGLVLVAYLRKSLPFPTRFSVMPAPLGFPDGESRLAVSAFGLDHHSDEPDEQSAQVVVRHYENAQRFVIELKTRTGEDEILLAKISQPESLRAGFDLVVKDLRDQPTTTEYSRIRNGEKLMIPKLAFNLCRDFMELHEMKLSDFADGQIRLARQGTAFVLNERGAELESLGSLEPVYANGHSKKRPEPRQFFFDQPFLLILREKKANQPYFLAWIANPEFMAPTSK